MKLWSVKSILPRSLFGRSLLILLFPVVVLQLIVGMVFIQRHFEKVTTQMASPVADELNYIIELVETAPNDAVAFTLIRSFEQPFGMTYDLKPDSEFIPGERRQFYDLSGKALIQGFAEELTHAAAVNLVDDPRAVLLEIDTNKGVLFVQFSRGRVSASNPHQLLVLMIFASIILTIISVLFLRNQVRPIRNLAQVSEAFGMGRHETYRPSGAIEVRRAGLAFLTMRDRIEKQIEQRTQMLSGVSHDLRTPLTRMNLSLAMMEETEEQKQLQNDVKDMETMLKLFLDYAQLDGTEASSDVNLYSFVSEIVENARRTNPNIEYTPLAIPDGLSNLVQIRKVSIRRAITNLLSNAQKYGNQTRISCAINENHFIVSVEDDGPGIPEAEHKNALQPFVRLDPARNLETAGVGLGLAIANDVAQVHGGELILSTSEKLGGLRVDLVIPI